MSEKVFIYPWVEHRSDDPTWTLYRIHHEDGKDYLMAYLGENLKEVYFVGDMIGNMYMSIRANDFTKISYYTEDRETKTERRFENGVLNKTYRDPDLCTCITDTHVYKRTYLKDTSSINGYKIYNDLKDFLVKFHNSGIKITRPDYVY